MVGVTTIKTFGWKPGATPPPLEDHSDAKLRLISAYLESYFPAILVSPAQTRQRITLVDGFCGGGRFVRDGQFVKGTPLLFLEAVEAAEKRANQGRNQKLDIDAEFHFVDSDKDHIDFLHEELKTHGYSAKIGQTIFLHNSKFEDVFPTISARIEKRTRGSVGRSIFLLDQLGYTDVNLEIVRQILRFSAAECILTFAVGWLIDYLSKNPAIVQRTAPIELSEAQISEFLRLKADWGGRYVIQRLLLQHLKFRTGTTFQSPFFLRSQKARKDLWLLHLSHHVKARNVMVDSHWAINNQSLHMGHGGLEMLGFDPKADPHNAPDFLFGQADRALMRERLAEDFLKRLHEQHQDDRLPYGAFVKSIANETPARLADIADVTAFLVSERELDLRNEKNVERRASTPTWKDTISLNRQGRFWSFKD
ncbi:three-Cys-motif partner protein TcmP [Rhizobium oryzicola]|uniref:Three-Cys-motif partner protein TcmP n=1 Tax=Rhizobium oryzicola TaxID=1232668 RepID=A0ABT8SVM6_9HYPH|nr:three-Cys-motif partner protein TcmP [Rhizobium oryzicola]MDO1582478.1 three-Cys-motif partner protein TcmP [Rhizobium oryzicola]